MLSVSNNVDEEEKKAISTSSSEVILVCTLCKYVNIDSMLGCVSIPFVDKDMGKVAMYSE